MRYCHISNHPYDYDEERDGCSCTAQWDDYEPSPVPLIGIVPGGANDTPQVQAQRKFDSDMHSYREARRAGLQPDMVSKQAVEKAEKKAYLEERVLKRVS